MTYAIVRRRAGPVVPRQPRPANSSLRRIFNNNQLIERYDRWLQVIGKRPNTRQAYCLAVKQFAQVLDKPLLAADKHDVRAFLSHLMTRNMGSGTRAARLFALRSFYDFLQLGEQVKFSVPRYILITKVSKRLPHAKTEEEIERLIAAAENPRDLAILELGYASGLRVSELHNLRVEDINMKSRTLIVREGKGGDDRIGLFGRKAAAALVAYIQERTSGPLFLPSEERLFPQQHGGVTCDSYGTWWGRWRETINGKRVMKSVRLGDDFEITTRERAREAIEAFLADKLPKERPSIPMADWPPLSVKGIYRVIKNAARRAGIQGVYPHILRHYLDLQTMSSRSPVIP
jgi:site-specific recombinase XerD